MFEVLINPFTLRMPLIIRDTTYLPFVARRWFHSSHYQSSHDYLQITGRYHTIRYVHLYFLVIM